MTPNYLCLCAILCAGFAFSTVNPPMALDLTLGVLCEVLQQWDEVSAGVPVLLEWLLGENDLGDLETVNTVIGLTILFNYRIH